MSSYFANMNTNKTSGTRFFEHNQRTDSSLQQHGGGSFFRPTMHQGNSRHNQRNIRQNLRNDRQNSSYYQSTNSHKNRSNMFTPQTTDNNSYQKQNGFFGNMSGNKTGGTFNSFLGNNKNTGYSNQTSNTHYRSSNNQTPNLLYGKPSGNDNKQGYFFGSRSGSTNSTYQGVGTRVGGNHQSSSFFNTMGNNQATANNPGFFQTNSKFGNQGTSHNFVSNNQNNNNNKSFFGTNTSQNKSGNGMSSTSFFGNRSNNMFGTQNNQNTSKSFFGGNSNSTQNNFMNQGQGGQNNNFFGQTNSNISFLGNNNNHFGKANQPNNMFAGNNKTGTSNFFGGQNQMASTGFFGNSNNKTGFLQNNKQTGNNYSFFGGNQTGNSNNFFGGNSTGQNQSSFGSNSTGNFFGPQNMNSGMNNSFNTNNPNMMNDIQQQLSMGMMNSNQQQLLPLLSSFYQGLTMNINSNKSSDHNSEEKNRKKLKQIEDLMKQLNNNPADNDYSYSSASFALTPAFQKRLEDEKALDELIKGQPRDLDDEFQKAEQDLYLDGLRSETLDALKAKEIIQKPARYYNPRPNKKKGDYSRNISFQEKRSKGKNDSEFHPAKFTQNTNPNITKNQKGYGFNDPDLLELRVTVNYTNETTVIEKFKVNRNCKIYLFKRGVIQSLDLFGTSLYQVTQTSKVTFSGTTYSNETVLKEIKNLLELEIILNINIRFRFPKKNEHSKKVASNLCPVEKLPVSSRRNYIIKPSLLQMAQMSLEEVQNVKDFSIENEFGKIRWPGNSNLVGLDLDVLVEISLHKSEVYPDDLYPREDMKPAQGTELNKRAIITLYNVPITDSQPEDFNQKLKEMAKTQDCQHIEYDPERERWTIQVEHFTIYSFLEKDDPRPKRTRSDRRQNEERSWGQNHIESEGGFIEQDSFSGAIEDRSQQRQMTSDRRYARNQDNNFNRFSVPAQLHEDFRQQGEYEYQNQNTRNGHFEQEPSRIPESKYIAKQDHQLEALSENVFKTEELTESQKIYSKHQNATQILQLFQIKTQTSDFGVSPTPKSDPGLKKDLETLKDLFANKILPKIKQASNGAGEMGQIHSQGDLFKTLNLISTGSAFAFHPVNNNLAIHFKNAKNPEKNLQIVGEKSDPRFKRNSHISKILNCLKKAFLETIEGAKQLISFNRNDFMTRIFTSPHSETYDRLPALYKVAAGADLATVEELLSRWNLHLKDLVKNLKQTISDKRKKSKSKRRKGSSSSGQNINEEINEEREKRLFELKQVRLAVQMLLVMFGGSESMESSFGARHEYLKIEVEKNEVLEEYFFQRKLLLWLENFRKSLFIDSEVSIQEKFQNMNLENISRDGSFLIDPSQPRSNIRKRDSSSQLPCIPNKISIKTENGHKNGRSIQKEQFLSHSKMILQLENYLTQKNTKVDVQKMITEFVSKNKASQDSWVLIPRLFLNCMTLWDGLQSKKPSDIAIFDGCGFSKEISIFLEFLGARIINSKVDPVLLKGKVSKKLIQQILASIQEKKPEKRNQLIQEERPKMTFGNQPKKLGSNFGNFDAKVTKNASQSKMGFSKISQGGMFTVNQPQPSFGIKSKEKPSFLGSNLNNEKKESSLFGNKTDQKKPSLGMFGQSNNALRPTNTGFMSGNKPDSAPAPKPPGLFSQNTGVNPLGGGSAMFSSVNKKKEDSNNKNLNLFGNAISGNKPENKTGFSLFGASKPKEKKSGGLFGANKNASMNFLGQNKSKEKKAVGGWLAKPGEKKESTFQFSKFQNKDEKKTDNIASQGFLFSKDDAPKVNIFSNQNKPQIMSKPTPFGNLGLTGDNSKNKPSFAMFGNNPDQKPSRAFIKEIPPKSLKATPISSGMKFNSQKEDLSIIAEQNNTHMVKNQVFKDNQTRLQYLNEKSLVSAIEICLQRKQYMTALGFVVFSGVNPKSKNKFANLVFENLNKTRISIDDTITFEKDTFATIIEFFSSRCPRKARLIGYKVSNRINDMIKGYLELRKYQMAQNTFYFSVVYPVFNRESLELQELDNMHDLADRILSESDPKRQNAFLIYVWQTIHLLKNLTSRISSFDSKENLIFSQFFERMVSAYFDENSSSESFKDLILSMNAGVLQTVSQFRGGKRGVWNAFANEFKKCVLGLPLKDNMMPMALALLTESQMD